MHILEQNMTFLTRYLYIMLICFLGILTFGLYTEYDVQGFTYNLPMLVAFASGVYFYRDHSVSPLSVLKDIGMLLSVIVINAVYFALMLYFFIDNEMEFNHLAVFLTMHLYAGIGLLLSQLYFTMYMRGINRSQTKKTDAVLKKAKRVNKKANRHAK